MRGAAVAKMRRFGAYLTFDAFVTPTAEARIQRCQEHGTSGSGEILKRSPDNAYLPGMTLQAADSRSAGQDQSRYRIHEEYLQGYSGKDLTMTVKEVLEKIAQDKDLAEKVKGMKNPEDVYEVAKSVGADMSFEEFKKGAEELNASLTKMSDADVDAISGGDAGTITTLTTTTTVTITASASAAAV